MIRPVLVFVHVIGAMGVFGALGIEGAVLLQRRRAADAAQRRTALTDFRLVPRVAVPSLLVTILSGLSLMATVIAMAAAAGAGWLAALSPFGRRTSQGSMVSA
jgi:hypothetical protein